MRCHQIKAQSSLVLSSTVMTKSKCQIQDRQMKIKAKTVNISLTNFPYTVRKQGENKTRKDGRERERA